MAQVAFVGIAVLALAALDGTASLHLAAVEEGIGHGIIELQGLLQMQMAVFMQAADEPFAHLVMDFAGMADAAAIVDGEADVIGIQGRLLLVVVAHDVVRDGPLELASFHELAITFVDGRAIAVGTGNESHVIRTDTVAQEARKTVSGNEDASHMTEMKRLVAVRHARRYHSASRPLHIAESLSHCPATPFYLYVNAITCSFSFYSAATRATRMLERAE